jgi:hypothetical protein
MRLVLAMVLAGLVALPLSVGAQAGEEGTEPTVEEPIPEQPAPPSEPAPEEPALKLELDAAGVEVAPSPPRTEYLKAPMRRARIGLAGSVIAFGGGVAMMGVGFANIEWGSNLFCFIDPCPQTPAWAIPLAVIGPLLGIGGLAGMIVSGKTLVRRKKQLRWYAGAPESHYRKPRRVQWDLAQSRLVF